MAVDESLVGRSYPPTAPYRVAREKIREFALAIGDDSPWYLDVAAAQAAGYPDVIAPPTFPIVVTMGSGGVVVTDLGIDFSRVVHGEQRFVYERPLYAGDTVVVTVTIDNLRTAAGNDLIETRSAVHTVEGEHVVDAFSMLVVRGPET